MEPDLNRVLSGLEDRITKLERKLNRLLDRFNRYYPEIRSCQKCGRKITTAGSKCKYCNFVNPEEAA